MSDEQEDKAPDANTDSAAVQAALRGIPGLAQTVGSAPETKPGEQDLSDLLGGSDDDEPPAASAPKPDVEDSDTVKEALRRFGLK